MQGLGGTVVPRYLDGTTVESGMDSTSADSPRRGGESE